MVRRYLSVLFCVAAGAAPLAVGAADGVLDPSFGTDGATFVVPDGVEGHELRANAAVTLPDGSVLVGGSRNKFINGSPDPHMRGTLVHLRADGAVDTDFGNIPGIPGLRVLPDIQPGTQMQIVEAVVPLEDGSILLAGSAEAFGPLTGFIVKLGADGDLDPAFGEDGIVRVTGTYVHALGVDDQGRIVAAGERSSPGLDRAILARFDGSGQPDPGFGTDGIVALGAEDESGYLRTLAITGDGAIVAGGMAAVPDEIFGSIYTFLIVRLGADGQPDAGFGENGRRTFVLPASTSPYNGVNRLVVDAGGRIVFGGYYQDDASEVQVVFGRLTADGSDDATFGDPAMPGYRPVALATGAWNRYVSGLARQSDGKLVASITYAIPDVRQGFMAVRLGADGALDGGFGQDGVFQLDLAPSGIYSDSTALTLQGGRAVLAGASQRATGSRLVDLGIVRLENDGIFTARFDD
ncbi:hypothetical protein [Dokdonella koreensis]|uniref:Delta-60 repeat protein n=1 Tax=Dokdonella koreensis DS-123 TaxID=1300342 RepID=A0A167H9A5_9GAMM|nr:hypothetical protein [Dokdonella koreensis]ANB19546.1 Hypothetical protein I596_3558 [Dokdonella koreensis DS-123]